MESDGRVSFVGEVAAGEQSHTASSQETAYLRTRILKSLWALLDKGLGHQLALFLADMMACVSGMYGGLGLATIWPGIHEPITRYLPSVIVLCFCASMAMYTLRGYRPSFLRRQERELEAILKSATFGFLMIFAFNFIVFKSAGFSRYIYVFDYVLILFFLMLGRFGIKRIYRLFWQQEIGRVKALVVGRGPESIATLRDRFKVQQFSRFQLTGYVRMAKGHLVYCGDAQEVVLDKKLGQLLEEENISTVFVSLGNYSRENHQVFLDILSTCEGTNRHVFVLSDTFSSNIYDFNLDEYLGLIGIGHRQSELEKRIPLLIKRVADMTGGLFLGVVLSPFFLAIAAAVRLQDGGPILHRRRVVGLHGKHFDALKFRTMVPDADRILEKDQKLRDQFLENFKLKDDPRITRVGRFLRKLSLDELPQLYNVFVGHMSLVGPRMVTPEELERYGRFKEQRIKIRPGLSGYWQVNGRHEVNYDERIQMDRFYMYRWNIWMDLWLILKTAQKVLKKEGAF